MALRACREFGFNYEAYYISAIIPQSVECTVHTPRLTVVKPVIVIPWPLTRKEIWSKILMTGCPSCHQPVLDTPIGFYLFSVHSPLSVS